MDNSGNEHQTFGIRQPESKRQLNHNLGFLIREPVVIAMVAINAIALFLAAFPSVSPVFQKVLFTIDYICILYFIVEVCLKLYTFGKRGYFGVGWNVFDFTIVVLSLPALAEPFGLDEFNFAALLVLRLARLFRFLRILKFIPNLDRMMRGARRALKASVGVLLVLLLWNFIFALAATYFFGLSEQPVAEFSDPLMSMYTMFKVFTIEGWYEMPDLMAQACNPFKAHLIRLFFIAAVVFGGIIILGLLNAVFVDEMTSDLVAQTEDEVTALTKELAGLRAEIGEHNDLVADRLARIQSKLETMG